MRVGGKSRLSEALEPAARRRLVLAMFDDVVAALRDGGVDDVRVLAGDDDAADAARTRDLAVLPDPLPRGDLRAAVDAGLAAVGDASPRLVVAADLPGLAGPVVADLLTGRRVTVLPTQDGGTAVLLLPAGVTVPARYGAGSAAAHVAAARDLGLDPVLLPLDPAGHDVDGVGDLVAAADTGVGATTAATLAATDVRRRT